MVSSDDSTLLIAILIHTSGRGLLGGTALGMSHDHHDSDLVTTASPCSSSVCSSSCLLFSPVEGGLGESSGGRSPVSCRKQTKFNVIVLVTQTAMDI